MFKKVLKFGGTSVGTIERIQHVAKIIEKERNANNQILQYIISLMRNCHTNIIITIIISSSIHQ